MERLLVAEFPLLTAKPTVKNNTDMLRHAAALMFATIFLATILCAVICPEAAAQGAHHVCDKPDHSCCPKSNHNSDQNLCVDTHFMGASKYRSHAPVVLDLTADVDTAVAKPITITSKIVVSERLQRPAEDVLAKHRLLRI
jgi:hypothetical protein